MRGSELETKMTGLAAVPATTSPVSCRVVTPVFTLPSSLWFGIDLMRVIVSAR